VSLTLDRQVQALLSRVHRVRDECIGELRAGGTADREAIEQGARREAHRLLRKATRAQRERIGERSRQALAEFDAQRRRRDFAQDGQLIEAALAALPAALERRWLDPPARRAWCGAALAVAAARLVARDWRIAIAAGGDAAEQAAVAAAAAAHGARAEFVPCAARAGLAISAGSSAVDATIAGLLTDRSAIAARLLAGWLAGSAP
jgi:hypothetical protein